MLVHLKAHTINILYLFLRWSLTCYYNITHVCIFYVQKFPILLPQSFVSISRDAIQKDKFHDAEAISQIAEQAMSQVAKAILIVILTLLVENDKNTSTSFTQGIFIIFNSPKLYVNQLQNLFVHSIASYTIES